MTSNHFDTFKIPFGIRSTDGELVDIHEVDRGLACCCICPSCKAPLSARKGEVYEWHFAHASRHGYKNEVDQCDYSFFVSIRMMAKKILESCNSICLPGGIVQEEKIHSSSGVIFSESIPYAVDKEFQPDSIRVECIFNDIMVDALLERDGKYVAIFFRCPDKKSSFMSSEFGETSNGALEVDLSGICEFHQKRSDADVLSYKDSLRTFLLNELGNKKWLYHPRKASKKAEAEEKIKASMKCQFGEDCEDIDGASLSGLAEPETESVMSKLRCFHCQEQWVGHEQRDRVCRRCNNALYVQIMYRYVDKH